MVGTELGPGALRVQCAGRDYAFGAGQSFVIGREADCDVLSENPLVSRHHARVSHTSSGWVLEDMGSSRGTHANGARVERVTLDAVTTVWLGPVDSGERVVLAVVDAAAPVAVTVPAAVPIPVAAATGGGSKRPPWMSVVAVAVVLALGAGIAFAVTRDDGETESTGATTTSGPTGPVETEVETVGLAFTASGPEGKPAGVAIPLAVRVRQTPDKPIAVAVSNTQAGATGGQWSAAAWNASMVATFVTGTPVDGREFTFLTDGAIDGPSAGALMTVATIAALRGDELSDDTTMTGTINPDGTIGPVGGIPYKLQGAKSAGRTKMLIPSGLNRPAELADFPGVNDMDGLGRREGIEVHEVSDIYEAYFEFTGVELPRLGTSGEPELSDAAKERFEGPLEQVLAEYEAARSAFAALDPVLQDVLAGEMANAEQTAEVARALNQQDLVAGALDRASLALVLAEAIVESGRLMTIYATNGYDAFQTNLVGINDANQQKLAGLFQTIKSDSPTTVADADVLIQMSQIASTAQAIDAVGDFYVDQYNQAVTDDDQISAAINLAFWRVYQGKLVDGADRLVGLGRVSDSAALPDSIDLEGVERFFEQAAIANLVAYESLRDPECGAQHQIEEITVQRQRAEFSDTVDRYFGDALDPDTTEYYKLGTALSLYSKSAGLLSACYARPFTGVETLRTSLELSRDEAERAMSVLTDRDHELPLIVRLYEIASIDQFTISDPTYSLTSLWLAYAESRALSYLLGIESEGFGTS
jgi:uncharacterized protein